MRTIVVLFLIFLCVIRNEITCQTVDRVNIRKFTQKDGLGSYNIRRIAEDQWGFIWIGTQDGLSRFDGRNFVHYSRNAVAPHRLSGSDIKELIEVPEQSAIWALSHEGGIDVVNSVTGRVDRTFRVPDLGNEAYNISLLRSEEELWIGSSVGVHIFNLKQNKFSPILPLPDGEKRSIDFAVRSMLRDEFGNIWVCYGGYGIVIYRGTTKRILKTISLSAFGNKRQASEIRIPTGVFLRSGEVLLASQKGLRKINYDKHYRFSVNEFPCQALPALNTENIDWITIDADNKLLISGFNSIYSFNYALTSYKVLQEPSRTYESNWLPSVISIYKDRSSNTWLGCQEGLACISKKRVAFNPYERDVRSDIKLDHVFGVSPVPRNKILVGLRSGLVEIDKGTGSYFQYDKKHLYHHIFTDQNGLIHISRPDGMFILDKGKIKPIHQIYPEFLRYKSFATNSHLLINDTLTILGTENNKGILVWNPLKKNVRSIDIVGSPALASSIVNNVFRDNMRRIWVLSDYAITILSPDLRSKTEIELKEHTTGTPYKLFFDMREANGSYWVASYGSGILEVDQNLEVVRTFSTVNGLSNDGVYQVYNLNPQELLVTTNNGISTINLANSKVSQYFTNDGLHANAFEEVSGVMVDGKIYAGGVNGFTVIDPAGFSRNPLPPKLYFTGIQMKNSKAQIDTSNIHLKSMVIPSDVIQTTVQFAGLNYPNPERTSYYYRLGTKESGDWIKTDNQPFISLMSIAPGDYTLEVKAANEDGVFSRTITLQLYFEPRWYQTWWFKFLILLVVAGSAYQYYRIRIGQLERENDIRRRLATDLHDDLGGTMNGINVYTNLAIMEYGNNRYLDHIKRGTQESISSIRDIIWILDDHKDTVTQLSDRIFNFASSLCEMKGIVFNIHTDGSIGDQALGKEEKRNLYLICKEAINNSIKYADPKHISVSISETNRRLSLSISDDGTGFEVLKCKTGNGLNNMRARAKEINYNILITSFPGTGVVIDLSKSK